MAKIIAVVIVIALAMGIVGGLVFGDSWLLVSTSFVMIGICALYAIGILKNPFDVVRVEADVETIVSGYPPQAIAPNCHEAISRQAGGISVPLNDKPSSVALDQLRTKDDPARR